jgi:nucleoside-diphosphate-sugar epimerase
LVTGANGYIGKSIVSWFSKSEDTLVIPLTRKDVDLRDPQSVDAWMKTKEFDVVIHAAAVGGSRLYIDDQSVLEQNISLFTNLFKHRDKFNKFISFGSGSEIYNPTSPYGMSKKLISDIINKHVNCYNVRIYGVFDENELSTRFIKSNIIRCLNDKPMLIHANKFMDFFYMKDLHRIVSYVINNNTVSNVIDCSYSERKTLLEIAHQINNICGKTVDIVCSAEQMADPYIGDSNLVDLEFVGFDCGLATTIDALRQNI